MPGPIIPKWIPQLPPQTRPRVPTDPVYTQQSPASPVHLSGSLVMRSGTNGAVPQAALKNPMGQDMEILEIKFELSGPSYLSSASAWGATIQCDLQMGAYKLTNGAIPVWNFGRSENLDGEMKFDVSSVQAQQATYIAYSWRLPRPLFVPAGAVVVPNFTHTGMVAESINTRIGYSARTVFRQPRTLHVPWVAKYVSKAFNPIENAGVDSSSELDLVNPNPEVFHLQRFTGRVLGGLNENTPQSFGSRDLNIRITDSYGRPIVRSYTPFRSVFGALTRSWDMDNGATLDPESFYRVNLRKDAAAMATPGAIAGQAFIAMVGWREVAP